MTNNKYVLNDKGEPVLEPDLITWAQWFETSWPARNVAREEVGDYVVSTVFLGLDHQFGDDGPPLVWETMVFECKLTDDHCGEEIDCDRCSGGREQAEAMHVAMVERLKAMLALADDTHESEC